MSETLYVNGYDRFKIIARQGARQETFDFSFKYAAMTEYYKKISIIDEYTNGSKSKIIHHVNYRWVIDYGNYAEKSDLLIWAEIENLEISGWKLYLIPHIDTEGLRPEFKVILNDDIEREIGLHSHFNTGIGTVNKGFLIELLNEDPHLLVNMIDPPSIGGPGIITGGGDPTPRGVIET